MTEAIANENEMKMKSSEVTSLAKQPKRLKVLPIALGVAAVAVVLIVILIVIPARRKPSSLFTAMNTESSVYEPNKMVRMLISIVDTDRNTLCHSNLQILITGPKKFRTELSTAGGSITTSTTCEENGTKTNNPDYQASFVPETPGKYKIELINLDSGDKVIKRIEVRNDSNFDIERYTTTRVNPSEKVRYHMLLRITSKNDFKGRVTEIIPETIVIAWKGEAKTEPGKITWEVDLKAGETKELTYDYQNPVSTPQTQKFGPASIISGNQRVFEEKNPWNILIGTVLVQE